MTDLTLHLRIVGATLLILAFSHLFFGRHFDWKTDLAKLALLNRQIFHVHTFFICLVLAMMGILSLFFPHALTAPPTLLAKLVLTGLTLFWGTRLLFQWFVYDWALWKGHRLNTTVHFVFTLLWSYFTLIFALALRQQFG
ncbi:MAG TPA: hypothetical protein VGQ99_10895 [Tepidisphaeraceae bacterium]|nr:hypothetical protein [Tepidisphaeraceae bacterium]